MSQTVMERTAEQIGKSVDQASRATSAIADAIEDGVGVARRPQSRAAMPLKNLWMIPRSACSGTLYLTVATTFAAGVTAGALDRLDDETKVDGRGN